MRCDVPEKSRAAHGECITGQDSRETSKDFVVGSGEDGGLG